MAQSLSARMGALWIQPDGPGTVKHFLDCKDLGDIVETETGLEIDRCFDPAGGWKVVGQRETPPEPTTFDITGLLFEQLDWLEKVKCPFSLYVTQSSCGRVDNFNIWERAIALGSIRRVSRTYSGLVMREEDTASTLAVSMVATPPLIVTRKMGASLEITTEDEALNAVWANTDKLCPGDCGVGTDPCEIAAAAADSAVGPATANVQFSTDFGETWAAATDPFGAGLNAMGITGFYIDADTIRYVVVEDAPAAGQGNVGYSDDDGATWTNVLLGGAAAGMGAVYGGGLFSLDRHHIWIAGANGYIHFSSDGGESWTDQEEGVIHAGDYNVIHFADEYYGIAGGAADIIAITRDGGASWEAATATGGGGDIFAAWRFDEHRMIVGTDDGTLWMSFNGGTSWTQITGWTGSGVGDVRALGFANQHEGFMVHNNATPVGTVLHTIDGGREWRAISTPDNDGLNDIFVCNGQSALVVGEVEAGAAVAVIIRVGTAESV